MCGGGGGGGGLVACSGLYIYRLPFVLYCQLQATGGKLNCICTDIQGAVNIRIGFINPHWHPHTSTLVSYVALTRKLESAGPGGEFSILYTQHNYFRHWLKEIISNRKPSDVSCSLPYCIKG